MNAVFSFLVECVNQLLGDQSKEYQYLSQNGCGPTRLGTEGMHGPSVKISQNDKFKLKIGMGYA